MNIKVKGGTKTQKKLAEQAVLFSCSKLVSSRLFFNLYCEIHICKPTDVVGSCVWEDTNIRPRNFFMELHRDLDKVDFITTACHETVHLKQYALSELKERYKYGHKWLWYDVDCSDLPYLEQPWEKEAITLEQDLYRQFIDYININ